ncbi:monofunctional biosynthetic peptidoglycan transglycosylase [Desulfovibrio sp. OttesenSCG-928-I05]|nr:monofunctional biosynthetic peptidoglycan transglycosylase [Desulfovibrio sp. OttesenSCG-928-I05]
MPQNDKKPSLPLRVIRWFIQPRGAGGVILRAALAVCLFLLLNTGRYVVWPPVARLATDPPEMTSFMEYRIQEARAAGNDLKITYQWQEMRRISSYLQLAVTIAEDDLFWDHQGFDFASIRNALESNLRAGRITAGGSTITQQLAKNLYFTPEKSMLRKIKEAIIAWRLERNLSKEQILELYLNVVEWGPGIFGAEAASRAYFKKSASRLTAREAAQLASMLPNPLVRTPNSAIVQRKSNGIVRTMQRRGAL